MEQDAAKRGRGRPKMEADERRRQRGFSLDDAEFTRLLKKAKQAGFGKRTSAYIIHTLQLAL